jgi:transcriptional regulator with XRE-family HTH domain
LGYNPAVSASLLIRRARAAAGLTQAQLAARAQMPQSTIARLEAAGSNPTIETLERVLGAAGARLEVTHGVVSGVDETLVGQNLRLTPAQRLDRFRHSYANVRELAATAKRVDGDLA